MTIHEIAARLVELCRKGEFETAQKELFSDDVVSIEPEATPVFAKETRGLSAVFEKNRLFDDMTEAVHSISISEPLIASHSFVAHLHMDITMKGKERMQMQELCLYQVKDGKIISEEFFM